jgi:hypothetical protein
MFTLRYNGMYINGSVKSDACYVTDDTSHFKGRMFKSVLAAKRAINKARKEGVPESR